MKKIMIITLWLVGMTAKAQPFDPFGTYTLMSIIDKNGNTIEKPFDQYKICMKDVSLTFVMEGDQFIIRKTDKNVLKYTGETPDAHDATATRIYDCDREHFTLKWWSTEPNHRIFPHNDWCIEHYALYNTSSNAGRVLSELNRTPNSQFIDYVFVSKKGKKFFDKALKNPILGRWKVLGTMDELRNIKQELQRLHEHPLQGTYSVVTLSEIIDLHGERGTIVPLELNGKKSFTSGNSEYKLKWLSKDIVAVEINLNNRIDYLIWERMDGNISIFQDIAKRYTKNQ